MADEDDLSWLRTPVAEQLAIEGSRELTGTRFLCTSLGRGQCAVSLVERLPEAQATVHFLDHFAARETREFFGATHPRLSVTCSAEMPDEEYDAAVVPLTKGGESELGRDLIQEAYHRVRVGGQFIAVVDNPRDLWLHHELEKLSKHITRQTERKGNIYIVKKKEPLKRLRDFSCQFAFRDNETLVQVVSRPSVFSHRRLDLGARALLEGTSVNAGEHVLDIGCGSGAVGLALALREKGVKVHGLDSNPRAAWCLLAGAALNGLSVADPGDSIETGATVSASVSDSGEVPRTGAFDVAVGNPPYFSNFKIADIFLHAALKGVRSGGRVYMVTQQLEWFVARMKQLFKDVQSSEHRGYSVVTAVRK